MVWALLIFLWKTIPYKNIQSIKYSVLGLGGIKHPAEADLFQIYLMRNLFYECQ